MRRPTDLPALPVLDLAKLPRTPHGMRKLVQALLLPGPVLTTLVELSEQWERDALRSTPRPHPDYDLSYVGNADHESPTT